MTQRLEIIENITRNVRKDSTITSQQINKIGNRSEEIRNDIKEYQNLTDRRLDDLESKTRVYVAVTDGRIDALENETRVHADVISNMTDGSYNTGNLIPFIDFRLL